MTCKPYPKPYKTRGKAVTPIPILPLFQKELTGQKNPENDTGNIHFYPPSSVLRCYGRKERLPCRE